MARALVVIACMYVFLLANAKRNPWEPATATWYGDPYGAGTDGGACGYGSLPNTPYGLDIAAGSPVLFKNGMGCGTCYKVKCVEDVDQPMCSGLPVKVVVTDECPGGPCAGDAVHFDLSGTAFGKLALPGKDSMLRNSGFIHILYKRVPCKYNSPVVFQVAQGSSPYWLEILVRYLDGPADLASVELQQAGTPTWLPMHQNWGANWCFNGGPLTGPFTLRLTSLTTGEQIVAENAIPENWVAGQSYTAARPVNFNP